MEINFQQTLLKKIKAHHQNAINEFKDLVNTVPFPSKQHKVAYVLTLETPHYDFKLKTVKRQSLSYAFTVTLNRNSKMIAI